MEILAEISRNRATIHAIARAWYMFDNRRTRPEYPVVEEAQEEHMLPKYFEATEAILVALISIVQDGDEAEKRAARKAARK